MSDLPSLQRVNELLNYDPETGAFLRRPSQYRPRGCKAGCLNNDGYVHIEIDNKAYLAHRLAWFIVYGEWPSSYIDHINRNRSDNRIINLRLATRAQNQMNGRYVSSSGFRGVHFDRGWRARITVDKKRICLGYFDTAEEAASAYDNAARVYHGEFATINFYFGPELQGHY